MVQSFGRAIGLSGALLSSLLRTHQYKLRDFSKECRFHVFFTCSALVTIGQTSLRYFSLYLGNSVAKLLSSSRLDCCRAKRARTTTGARRNRGRVKSRHSSCSQASEHFPVTSSCDSAAEIEQNAELGGAAAGHHPQKGCPICRYVDGWCGTCCEKLLPLHPPLVSEALDTTPKLGTHPSPGVWLPPQQVNTIPNHQQASSTSSFGCNCCSAAVQDDWQRSVVLA